MYITIYFITYTILSPLIPLINIIACGNAIIIIISTNINILFIILFKIKNNKRLIIINKTNASCSITPKILGFIS